MAKKRKKAPLFNFELMDSSSTTECTGITPRPPVNDSEYESYHEVFHFGPPKQEKK